MKRSKVPSFLKGELGRVQTQKHTRSLSKTAYNLFGTLGKLKGHKHYQHKKLLAIEGGNSGSSKIVMLCKGVEPEGVLLPE